MKYAPFEEVRQKLAKQYENAVYSSRLSLSEEEIKKIWEDHKKAHPDEERILSRAFLISLILRHAPIAEEKYNPFPGKFQTFDLLHEDMRKGMAEAAEKVPGVQVNGNNTELGCRWMIDRSHAAPDWKNIARLGLPGLIKRAEAGSTPFHKAVKMVYESLAEFCRRTAVINDNPVYAAIAERPPASLHEAFALAYVFHDAIEFANVEVRTMGRFDEIYIGFLRKDLEEKRLDRDSAKELIKFFLMAFYARYQGSRFGKNFCFGPDFNELSRLGIEAYHELDIVDIKYSVLVRKDTPGDILELCAEAIRSGRNGIVFLNHEVVTRGLIRHGRKPEDAANFVPIGCYEPAVAGKEISCSGGSGMNLAAPVLRALNSGKEPLNFESFMELYKEYLRKSCIYMQEQQILCDMAWKYALPAPLLSGTFDSCMERGRDMSDSGAEYNSSGCVIQGIADAADSLAAIRYMVYEEKLCTIPQLKEILEANWQGFEELRSKVIRKAPKWGNNDPGADEIAVETAAFISKELWTLPNGRGGHFFPALFGQMVVERGRAYGAFPSGRLAGEPLSKNMCAAIGMDKKGITALMASVLKIDMEQFPNGTCLDLMLHPTSVRGEEGLQILVSIIRTFISKGGSGLQFNIFDAEKLREAQRTPENFRNLQVRVCGWNSRFVELSPEAQETFIKQADQLT